ncbi:MAG: DUF1365 domain-containing protein [Planctomycetota bacterium]|nr:DUF1365 domain-containing protein [Planctomycetota bacterium]
MRSQVFHGETMHCRYQPRRHAFRYRMFWLAIDPDELPQLDRSIGGFGHNRAALVSIRDRDYGGRDPGSIRGKITEHVQQAGVAGPIERITLMTIPKILGYVFNPVSFYLCYDGDDRIAAFVAEVRNTFGEMHHYVMEPAGPAGNDGANLDFRLPKEFYVSPFFGTGGEYAVRLKTGNDRFDITITLHEDDRPVFTATMRGRGRPLTTGRLLRTLGRLPLFATTIMWRIHWQAVLLRWKKRVPLFAKPVPSHPATIPARRGSVWYRLRAAALLRLHAAKPPPTDEAAALSERRE